MESSLHIWLGSLAAHLFTAKQLHMLEIAVSMIKTKYPSFEVAPSPQRIYPDLDYFNYMQNVTACLLRTDRATVAPRGKSFNNETSVSLFPIPHLYARAGSEQVARS